jgi:propanol-preferring alcohol dehydrogenase
MAEYMRADPIWTVKLPDSLAFEAAAPLMCAGSAIFNSIYCANQPKGAIVGIGGLGYFGLQFAKALARGYPIMRLGYRVGRRVVQ